MKSFDFQFHVHSVDEARNGLDACMPGPELAGARAVCAEMLGDLRPEGDHSVRATARCTTIPGRASKLFVEFALAAPLASMPSAR